MQNAMGEDYFYSIPNMGPILFSRLQAFSPLILKIQNQCKNSAKLRSVRIIFIKTAITIEFLEWIDYIYVHGVGRSDLEKRTCSLLVILRRTL